MYNMTPKDAREIKKIIFEHFEYIEEQWHEFQQRRKERKEFSLRDISKALFQASKIERNAFEVSPSGYGIHWTIIDEDLSIDGLLGVVHIPKDNIKNI